MAQSKQEILALLGEANGMSPRHRFGQNFMIDQNLVRLIADAGQITTGDLVIEVGPGTGTLTEELLDRGANVVAVEIDRDLAAMLRSRLSGRANFRLIEGDALSSKHALNAELAEVLQAHQHDASTAGAKLALPALDDASMTGERATQASPLQGVTPPIHPAPRGEASRAKLVANLPYNIASPLIIDLLLAGVGTLVFTVQKEVADRLRAPANGDAYGPLTVVAQLLAEVEVLRTLPPQAFWPPPKIDSALVRMTRKDQLGARARDVSRFVQQLFSARRKTLRRALLQFDHPADDMLKALSLNPQQRPEELSPAQFLQLFQQVPTPPA